MNLAEFWPLCLNALQSEIPTKQFDAVIAPLTVGEADGAWVVFAKNQFAVNLLRSQYAPAIAAVKARLAADAPDLVYKVGSGTHYAPAAALPETAAAQPEAPAATQQPERPKPAATVRKDSALDIIANRMNNLRPAAPAAEAAPPAPVGAIDSAREREAQEQRQAQTNLSPDYTFDTLVEGKGNQLAAGIARAIAETPGDGMYNPFFVYGSTGLGKTHLAQAAANRLLALNPQARVRYMHANDYLKSFMDTVRNKSWDTFKQQYLHYNLLIIDDIQFIQGKERTMEEFFLLFEHFHSRNQQLILTCDQLPSSLAEMDARLVSRFSWGMTVRLEPPELEMRVDILERKAQASGMVLSEDAALFIAQNVKKNVRELEGALNRVMARARFEKRTLIDIDLAADTLQDIVVSNYKPITPELIIQEVARYYDIRISEILGKNRKRNLARPRQIGMALTKELTGLSLPAIGEAFGGRDHTTVMHACKTVAQLRKDDPDIRQDYDKLLILIQN